MKHQRFEDYLEYWDAVRRNLKNLNLRDIYEELGQEKLAEKIGEMTEQEMMLWLKESAGFNEEQIEAMPEMTEVIAQAVIEGKGID